MWKVVFSIAFLSFYRSSLLIHIASLVKGACLFATEIFYFVQDLFAIDTRKKVIFTK